MKCPESVRLINNYIDLTAAFEEQGVPKKTTMVGFSERAARPLFEKRNASIKDQAIAQIAEVLRGGSRCTAGDTKRILQKLKNNGRFSAPGELPPGVFNVVYADPPWPYEHSATISRSIESHYPIMSLEEISELGKRIPFAEKCILFLWATNPKLSEALEVLKAWGFSYRTNFVWVKDKIGMGYYCRGQHELLLIAVKGEFAPPPPGARASSVVVSPREGHSEKPPEFYSIIEKMYPHASRLELFARGIKRAVWRDDLLELAKLVFMGKWSADFWLEDIELAGHILDIFGLHRLTAGWRSSSDKARQKYAQKIEREFAKRKGWICRICHRLIWVEKSVQRTIGPVCYKHSLQAEDTSMTWKDAELGGREP